MACCSLFTLTSCSSDDDLNTNPDDGNDPSVDKQYVIAANDGENSYLVTADSISNGQVSPLNGNGKQVIGTPSWHFFKDIAAYSFVYRKGDPGTTQSFVLNPDGSLKGRNEIDLSVSMQSKGRIGNELYLEYSSRDYEEPEATFYKINGLDQSVGDPIVINTESLADNGEYAYITDIAEHDDEILMGFRTIKAGEDGSDNLFESDYNDHTYVGVFNQDMELENVIEDQGRTGMVAGQFRGGAETGVEPVDNGDIYVFSSAMDADDTPSGVLKINAGDLTQFDADYFFDISEASGGHKLYRPYYVGESTFVLQLFDEPNTSSATPDDTRHKFAVVDVADQSFEWVDNVPNGILSIGEPMIEKEEHRVVLPMETSGYPHLYSIDANTATMQEGLKIKAEGVDAVGRLSTTDWLTPFTFLTKGFVAN